MSSTSTPGPLPPDISRGCAFLVINWLSVSVALLFVSLRFYIRGSLRKYLGWDDYTILLAMALAIVQSIFATFQVQSGFGRNIYYLSPVQIKHFGLHTSMYVLVHTVGTGLARISVCLFVLRLVPAIYTSYRRWIWGLAIVNTIVSLADFFTFCFQCIPFAGLWDKSVKARCFSQANLTKVAQAQGGSAAITDLLCVLLPMLVFRNLQVSRREKLAVFIILGLGFFTAATAIARTVIMDLAVENPTWDLVPVGIWTCLEQNIGITVASMPALRQLLTIRKKYHSSVDNQHDTNTRTSRHSFTGLSNSDQIPIHYNGSSTDTSSLRFSTLKPETSDIESCRDSRSKFSRSSMILPPIWTDRKISSAEKVEMSRVSPTTTFVERKASTTPEKRRLSIVVPSWGHRKTSSADKAYSPNSRKLSMISPLSLSWPSPPFCAAGKAQQGSKFEETGLRFSRAATPDAMMSLGNPATMGYSCTIEGGTPKSSPKTSPKLTSS